MIRPATVQDIPRIVELGRMLHAASNYADSPYEPAKVTQTMTALIAGAGVVFVSEKDGVIVGGIAGGITEQWFNNEKVAYDYSFFVEPSARHGLTAMKLMRAFEIWAEKMGAKRLNMGITTGVNVEATSKFYRAMGMKDSGVLFTKEIGHGR